jgi:NADPH-dependent 2,4-dienoyl-CoA reductase/sulfur reductase-like enzyme
MTRPSNATNGQTQPRIVVIGAGPAGMAACDALLQNDLPVTLIDESNGLGGQYYKRFTAAADLSRGTEIDELRESGAEWARRLDDPRLTYLPNTLVWGIFPERRLALYVDVRVELMQADALLLAGGAVERVAAFPGWTLPGVMTAGGAQTLLAREGILVGRRFLLTGTGPLLLEIALEIAEAGGEIVAVVEGSSLSAPVRQLRKFVTQTKRMRQAFDYHRELRRRKIPLLSQHMIVAAHGDDHVSEAVVARIDGDWQPISGSEQRFAVDTVCLHYGFAASTELAHLAGAESAYDQRRGGWYIAHDDGMRTSASGVFVAGQTSGIGGADLAEATGRLAGLSIAHDLDYLPADQYTALTGDARREIDRGRQFAEMLNTTYTAGPGVNEPITSNTLICRCEEVRAAQVDAAIEEGALDLNDVKRLTRCGMGFCQGRICSQVLVPYIAQKTGRSPEDIGQFHPRPPIKPVPLGALATMPDPESIFGSPEPGAAEAAAGHH